MKKGHVVFVVSFICMLAVLVQITRSEKLMRSFKNYNQQEALENPTKGTVPEGFKREKMLVIHDEREKPLYETRSNIERTLQYMRVDYDDADSSKLSEAIDSYSVVIVCMENLSNLPRINELMDYAKSGGSLFFAVRPLDNAGLAGIKKQIGMEQVNGLTNYEGIKFDSNILFKGKGYDFKTDKIVNSSLNCTLSDNAELLAEDSYESPLCWRVKNGKGMVTVFNGTMLSEKNNRGIIAGVIGVSMPDFMYPIMNLKLNFIDDFPAPVPEGYNKEVKKQTGLTVSEFYREEWWPFIVKVSSNCNLINNGFVIQTYEDRVKAPFSTEGQSEKEMLLYGRELLKAGGEIGLHGFNHQSLAPAGYIKQDLGYKSWDSKEDMGASIASSVKYINEFYPLYDVRAYVPPSNILSPEGREALLASSHVNIISSVYVNNAYGDAYAQEYEISKDGVYEIPRVTAGYDFSNETRYSLLNAVTSLGVFSHFVHPDDAFNVERSNGKTWNQLSKEYADFMKYANDSFNWLRPKKISDAAMEMQKYLQVVPYFKKSDNSVEAYFGSFRQDTYFVLRTDKKLAGFTGCSVKQIDDGIYLVDATASQIKIQFK